MFEQKRAYWRSLDNAAKLFSAASSPKDTRVFRFYCELKEEVEENVLQEALDQTIEKYPVFLSVMRKGLFWHYLEKSELRPIVRKEYKEPCSSLYVRDKKTLLFEVTYYKKRINFEVFHALTDGTGATEFLRELVKNYLHLVHKDELEPVELSDQYLAVSNGNEDLISETYDSMQKDLLAQIHGLEMQLKELDETAIETPDVKDKLRNALDVVDKIIAGGTLDRRDIELLIEKIVVDEDGMPEITLKYGLSNLIHYSPADEMNRRENTIIAIVMKLIAEDERGYTSAKYLSEHITDLGFQKTKQSILPYIELAKSLGILEPTENSLKPYRIVKSKEEITVLVKDYLPDTSDISAETTAKQLSDEYLHCNRGDRRHA